MSRLAVIILSLSLLTVGALMLGACGTNVVVIQPTPTPPPPPDIAHTTISAGGFHTCGIREDTGEAACWGLGSDPNAEEGFFFDHDYDQSTPPEGVRFLAVSAGGNHTCGIREDTGEATCWGLGSDPNAEEGALDYDQSTPPEGVRFLAVSAGGNHTCGIREDTGEATCWGLGSDPNTDESEGNYDQSTPPEGVRFLAVSAGGAHTCGIREDTREATCWGLGSDPNADESFFFDYDYDQSTPPEGVRFLAVSAGRDHTCGIREDDAVVCWGFDFPGESFPPSGKFRIGNGD